MSRTRPPEDMIDEDGHVVAWHSGNEADLVPRPFMHLGNEAQARMRGGRFLSRVTLRTATAGRLVDRGENGWSEPRLRRLAQTGCGYAVYLNRFEGTSLEETEAARAQPLVQRRPGGLDAVTDGLFRRLVPSARDSLVLLDVGLVVSIETEARKAERRMAQGQDAPQKEKP
jgi:hypothetical protein